MIPRTRLLALAGLISLVGCAEGDSLFADAGAVHSGAYTRSLAAQQQQIKKEQSRTAALKAHGGELKQRGTALNAAIEQERHEVTALRARTERLDRDIRSRQVATTEAEAKRAKLERQVAELRGEIAAVQQRLAGAASGAELEQLKAQKAELEERLSELVQLYQALL